MSNHRNELESRWRPEYDQHPIGGYTKPSFVQALNLIDKLAAHRAEADKDVRLSDVGKRDKVRSGAAALAKDMVKIRGLVAEAKVAVEKQRADLAPKVKDKTDLARALLRQEVRTFLRGMKPGEAVAYACQQNIDPVVCEAIFEAPSLVPSVSEVMDHILRTHLNKTAGSQLAAIAEQSQAIVLSEAAVRIAQRSLAETVGAQTPAAFEAWLSENAPGSPRESNSPNWESLAQKVGN